MVHLWTTLTDTPNLPSTGSPFPPPSRSSGGEMLIGTCSGDVYVSATCAVSAPKSVWGFLGGLKVSSSGRGAKIGLGRHTVELANINTYAQSGDQNLFLYINVCIRTRIPVLFRLLHRDRRHRHFRPPSRCHRERFKARSTYSHVPGGYRRWFIVVLIVYDDSTAWSAAEWPVAAMEG